MENQSTSQPSKRNLNEQPSQNRTDKSSNASQKGSTGTGASDYSRSDKR